MGDFSYITWGIIIYYGGFLHNMGDFLYSMGDFTRVITARSTHSGMIFFMGISI